DGRVRTALAVASRPASRVNRWAAAAAALLVGVTLLTWGVHGGRASLQVVREAVLVDEQCDRAGHGYAEQRRCHDPRHANALRVAPGVYWRIAGALRDDVSGRGRRLHVEGELDRGSRTLRLTAFRELGSRTS
ncbi:MAG TPA: hypothetical protein VJS92_06395, partial [Candidatus Polarisedimenticolaceae bacterium]|nr:hypothetical protein [Candidatus Polarisedimenticolaceae bacterium]